MQSAFKIDSVSRYLKMKLWAILRRWFQVINLKPFSFVDGGCATCTASGHSIPFGLKCPSQCPDTVVKSFCLPSTPLSSSLFYYLGWTAVRSHPTRVMVAQVAGYRAFVREPSITWAVLIHWTESRFDSYDSSSRWVFVWPSYDAPKYSLAVVRRASKTIRKLKDLS